MTGCGIISSVWGIILQWGSTIKVSIELPVATRHRRDMTEKLLKVTLNRINNNHTWTILGRKKNYHRVPLNIAYFRWHAPRDKRFCWTFVRNSEQDWKLLVLLNGPRQANLVLIAYASSEGSGEPAHLRSLARTSAARSYKQWVKRNLQTESRSVASLNGWACAVKIYHDGMLEDTNSLDGAQMLEVIYVFLQNLWDIWRKIGPGVFEG